MMILEYKHPLLLDKVAFQFKCFSEIFNNKLGKYCIRPIKEKQRGFLTREY